MNIDGVEAALRRLPLPSAPRSLRARVLRVAEAALPGLRPPRPRFAPLSVAGALVACAAVMSVVLLETAPPVPKEPETVEELLACLQDPGAPGRARAVAALGELGGRKALPMAASLLRDPDPDVRVAAAILLCSQGAVDAGVPALLREGRELAVLNSLKHPEAWTRLAQRPEPELRERTGPDRLRRIARAAASALSLPGPVTAEERRWTSELRKTPAQTTMIGALTDAVKFGDGSPGPYEIIVEPGTIRLVPRSEALRLWRAWWESQ